MATTINPKVVPNYPVNFNKKLNKLIDSRARSAVVLANENYSISDDSNISFVQATAASASCTVTLPNAAKFAGKSIDFRLAAQSSSFKLIIAQNADNANIAGADENYDDADAAGDEITLISTGTEWLVVKAKIAPTE